MVECVRSAKALPDNLPWHPSMAAAQQPGDPLPTKPAETARLGSEASTQGRQATRQHALPDGLCSTDIGSMFFN